ncbi:MAG: carbohydrate ABC transporter permease, partial [Verrucomicrobiae bacterium]|nr:carbohydrate ABC transporter permease [Verrucomicrobiae bacterium]
KTRIQRITEMISRYREPRWATPGTWSFARTVAMALLGFVMLTPFVWMLLASFKPLPEVERLDPVPRVWQPQNYAAVLGKAPDERTQKVLPIHFTRWYFNSLFIASWVTFLHCLTSAMAAYAFSRLTWPGRDRLFLMYLATLMVPEVVTMIPNYALMVKLHLIDTYAGLIIPAAFSAFGTFMLRQFMLSIPRSFDEAAEMDGAGPWQIFWDVILPLARPGLMTLAILTFLGNFMSFFWPLILIKSEQLRTLPVGMLFFDSSYGRQTNYIMAATVMNILPLIAIYLAGQKFLVKGIQLGGIKG